MSVASPSRWSVLTCVLATACLCSGRNQPKRPWQTDAWIEEMRRSLRPHQFARMIENRFVASEETFIDMAWWDACTTGRPVMADASMPVWAAVDASVKHDSTALLACTWDKETKRVRQVWHRIFQPSPDRRSTSKAPSSSHCWN